MLYFAKHQYGNTIGRDLWNALGAASGRDVAAFMDSWLEQPGYPVLTAIVENDTLKISQKQFFIGEKEEKGRLWVVPLNSNWTGIPDTLETERLKFQIIQLLQLKMKEHFVLIRKIQRITLLIIKANC